MLSSNRPKQNFFFHFLSYSIWMKRKRKKTMFTSNILHAMCLYRSQFQFGSMRIVCFHQYFIESSQILSVNLIFFWSLVEIYPLNDYNWAIFCWIFRMELFISKLKFSIKWSYLGISNGISIIWNNWNQKCRILSTQ